MAGGSGGPTRTLTPGYPTLTGEGMEGKGIPRGLTEGYEGYAEGMGVPYI